MFKMTNRMMRRSMSYAAGTALLFIAGCAQHRDHPEIRAILDRQTAAWNQGDLAGFMEPYWHSDDLEFATPDKATRGWQATFDRYARKYDTPRKMGSVRFEEVEVSDGGNDLAHVSGRYVHRVPGAVNTGRFYLTLRRIGAQWVITRDQTTPDK